MRRHEKVKAYAFGMLFLTLGCSPSLAMKEEYAQGVKLGEAGIHLGNPSAIDDGFLRRDGNTSNLTALNDTSLSGKGGDALSDKSGPGELLYASESSALNAREEHQINQEDAFIKSSMAIESDPLKETGGKYLSRSETREKDVTYTCREGVTFEVDLMRQLVYEPNIKIEEYWSPWSVKTLHLSSGEAQKFFHHFGIGGGGHGVGEMSFEGGNWDSEMRPYLAKYLKVPPDTIGWTKGKIGYAGGALSGAVITYQSREKKKKIFDAGGKEYWQVINSKDEDLLESHGCHEVKRICLDKGKKDFGQGVVVTRPCWKEKITHRCRSEPQEGCNPLRQKGCCLKDSLCLDKRVIPCLKWERTYLCKEKEEIASSEIQDSPLFCLDGGCHTPQVKKNTGLNEAAAYLALFQEMKKEMEGNPPKVFKGEEKGCSTHLLNFTNCCTSMDGWGVGVGLSSCSAEEKSLSKQRDQKQCHYVGTYCADKVLGVCTRKKSTYCCFGSKISRLFHEQGRPQLGKGWGSAKDPDCAAFSVEELSKLDFSKMDLSELFSDLMKNIDKTALKKMPHQMKGQMPTSQGKMEGLRKKAGEGGENVKTF